MMRILTLALAASLALTGCAHRAQEPDLYSQLGGRTGIERLVDVLLARVLADARINHLFTATDPADLQPLIVEQICEAAGGPCEYRGRPMDEAHMGLNISEAQFAAFVEDLQVAMDDIRLASPAQHQLLGLLAPMKREIVGQ